MDVQALQGYVHLFACKGCVEGKKTKRPFPMDEGTCITKILKLMYYNVYGPMNMMSIGGGRYFFTFVDNFPRKIWMYVLKAKNEVLANSKNGKP